MSEIGNIKEGRPNLGEDMPVEVYRLFEISMLKVLVKHFGQEKADDLVREAGYVSGMEFARTKIEKGLEFNDFITKIQELLSEYKIGILRIERANLETGELTIAVYEDLDCSGLPVTDEQVCVYDEGFLAGVLEFYTGKVFNVREVDCWASGDRVCRFKAKSE